jgi:hypothetical protein
MRGVLVGTDYIQDTDGSFKILEINTNVGFVFSDCREYINEVAFDNFLIDNEITKITYLLNKELPGQYGDLDENNNVNYGTLYTFQDFLFDKCADKGISLHIEVISPRAITVPYIENSPNELILRQVYDTTALVDSTYAKDNFEFLKLMYDTESTSIPKTYFINGTLGFDTIGSDIRDNGVHPNFIIKERYPTTNYGIYPKVFKIDTIEELETLKTNLPENTLLQEYIVNTDNLVLGKQVTYRTIDVLYGDTLSILNLFQPFEQTNPCPLSVSVDYDDNNEIQYWERPVYLQKHQNSLIYNVLYHLDDNSFILKSDGTFVNGTTIQIDDDVKSANLYELPLTGVTTSWSATTENVLTGSTIGFSKVKNISKYENVLIWVRRIELEDGIIFSDVPNSSIAVDNNGITKYKKYQFLEVGDGVVLYDMDTESFVIKNILNIKFQFTKQNVSTLDIEDIDNYMVVEEENNQPRFASVQSNAGVCASFYQPSYGNFPSQPNPPNQNNLRNGFGGNCNDLPPMVEWGERGQPNCSWSCTQPCEPFPPGYDPMSIPMTPQWYVYFYGANRSDCERQMPYSGPLPTYTCNYCDYFCCAGELTTQTFGPVDCSITSYPPQYVLRYDPPSGPGEFFTCETSNTKEHGA